MFVCQEHPVGNFKSWYARNTKTNYIIQKYPKRGLKTMVEPEKYLHKEGLEKEVN